MIDRNWVATDQLPTPAADELRVANHDRSELGRHWSTVFLKPGLCCVANHDRSELGRHGHALGRVWPTWAVANHDRSELGRHIDLAYMLIARLRGGKP